MSFPADVDAANGTTVTASPSHPYAGQTVTLTAGFVVPCADGVSSAYFVIDGKKYPVQASGAYNFVARLKISSLRAGSHRIEFQWSTQMYPDLSCGGSDTITLTVLARPSPVPSPKPRLTPPPSVAPSPAASPSLSPSPSARSSPTPVASGSRTNGLEPAAAVIPEPINSLGAVAIYLVVAAFAVFMARRP